MNIAIIGRTKTLFDTALVLHKKDYKIKLVITAKAAAEYKKTSDDFENLALKLGAEYIYSPHINKEDIIRKLKQYNLDIAISVNYPNVISQEVIDQFRLGILNAHGGDLPKYRGNACQAWAILNAEDRIGLCIHKMIGGELDSGDIIARDYFNLTIDTKVTKVHNWMTERVPVLFGKALVLLQENPNYVLEIQSKDPSKSLRCYPRKPEDGKINWKASATEILRLINACNKPYYGAFSDFEGGEVKIWDAELVEDDEIYTAIPGQVSRVNKDDETIDVICGESKLKMKLIEVANVEQPPTNLIKSIRKRFT